jgi:hypothetical protein
MSTYIYICIYMYKYMYIHMYMAPISSELSSLLPTGGNPLKDGASGQQGEVQAVSYG